MFPETSSRNSSHFPFEQEIVSVPDSAPNSILIADAPCMSPTPSFILYPEISVFPEVDSVDIGEEASIWVAVVMTGVLRRTIERQRIPNLTGEGCSRSPIVTKAGE
jgi:hypothetical protein